MKKASPKKETVLSVLKKIQKDMSIIRTGIDLLLASDTLMQSVKSYESPIAIKDNEMTITFPKITAKEIVESCNNHVDGGKLLYNTSWYATESFYTTEPTRPGKRIISLELLHAGKSWNEIDGLKGTLELLNVAEVVYLLKESAAFRELLSHVGKSVYYTWTNSRESDGFLVLVGGFDSDGAHLNGWGLGFSDSSIGVCLSRSVNS